MLNTLISPSKISRVSSLRLSLSQAFKVNNNNNIYLLEPGLELCSGAAIGVCISILNLAVAVTLVTWPCEGEALREEPVLEPWDTNKGLEDSQ